MLTRGIDEVYMAMVFNIILDLIFVLAVLATAYVAFSSKPSSPGSVIFAILSGLILFSPLITLMISIIGRGFPANRVPTIIPGSYVSIASAFILLISLAKITNISLELDKK